MGPETLLRTMKKAIFPRKRTIPPKDRNTWLVGKHGKACVLWDQMTIVRQKIYHEISFVPQITALQRYRHARASLVHRLPDAEFEPRFAINTTPIHRFCNIKKPNPEGIREKAREPRCIHMKRGKLNRNLRSVQNCDIRQQEEAHRRNTKHTNLTSHGGVEASQNSLWKRRMKSALKRCHHGIWK